MSTITPADIWSTHGKPRAESAERLGLSRPDVLRRAATRMGFVRPLNRRTFTAGPCTDCGETWPEKELDADRKCPVCLDPDPMLVRLEWERAESRRRMQRPGREKRIGKRRPICRPVEW